MRYTQEMKEFMKAYVPGHHYAEIVEAFNAKFEEKVNVEQIKRYIAYHHLNTGFTGRFVKGQPSHNKGKKQSDFMTPEQIERSKQTRFKKGSIPHNYLPVGSVVVSTDGYHMIKIAEPNKWKLYGRYLWEQTYGKIPKGHVLIHINGDRLDDRLENLRMIKNRDLSRVNKIGLCDDADINTSVINLAQLQTAIQEKLEDESRRHNKVP